MAFLEHFISMYNYLGNLWTVMLEDPGTGAELGKEFTSLQITYMCTLGGVGGGEVRTDPPQGGHWCH